MKKIVCEMCGDTNIVKQEGFFVCQSCGCKYTLEEAKKLMDGAVVQIDNSNNLDTYRRMADETYNSGDTKNAYQYYLKVLEIDPKDYHAIFYKGMCKAWETTLGNPKIQEAFSGFSKALEYIPPKQSKELCEEYVNAIVGLMKAWYEKARDRYLDRALEIDEWYDFHKDVFWDYLGVCELVVKYLDSIITVFNDSTSAEFRAKFGELYCDAIYGFCDQKLIYNDFSKSSYQFIGIDITTKKKFLQKYDNMIFEVRKYKPDFRKLDYHGSSVWGLIDRTPLPTRIGAHNQAAIDQSKRDGIAIDNEINKRVAAWRADEQKRLKAKKEKEFWESHPEDKEEFDQIKKEYDEAKKIYDDAKRDNEAAINTVEDTEKKIQEQRDINADLEKQIEKLQKKIFGKEKAQNEIIRIEEEIRKRAQDILDAGPYLDSLKEKRVETTKALNNASTLMNNKKATYENFLKKRGLM